MYYITLMIRSNLENMPFKPSEQKSTLAGNARMFARLLCSVLRTVQQKHKWCEDYPFDEKQMAAVDDVYTALDVDKSEEADVAVIAVIHKLALTLFCKERKDISKGDFCMSGLQVSRDRIDQRGWYLYGGIRHHKHHREAAVVLSSYDL